MSEPLDVVRAPLIPSAGQVTAAQVDLSMCNLYGHCQKPSIISCCDLVPPVCPMQGKQLKCKVMKTARHERAFHQLIKGTKHNVFTTRILRPIGLEMWLGKKENQRGYLEINL